MARRLLNVLTRPIPATHTCFAVRLLHCGKQTLVEHRHSKTWAQRLKRNFGIDIDTCGVCGCAVKVIGCIKDPAVINKILTHLDQNQSTVATNRLPKTRAPPPSNLPGRR